jgi:antitoxin component YwqK of YwqJK toxin-antitoxin module
MIQQFDNNIVIEHKYSNGNVYYREEIISTLPDGRKLMLVEQFSEKGKLMLKYSECDFDYHGTYLEYYSTGVIKITGEYRHGQQIGFWFTNAKIFAKVKSLPTLEFYL